MALLLPADFDLTSLPESEQRVVRSFLTGLDDSWVAVPSVPVTVGRSDHEIDVVLASATRGVVLVEVPEEELVRRILRRAELEGRSDDKIGRAHV